MISMKMIIDGREVGPDGFADALGSAIFQNVQSQVVSRVEDVVCPEHGETPEIVAEGRDMSSLSFNVRGCCNKAIDEVRRRIEGE